MGKACIRVHNTGMSHTAHFEDFRRPLVVFADDWGRHPSSCQHLVRELLPTRSVLWVNTIGTRPPRLDRATARRALGKLSGWFLPKTRSPSSAQSTPHPEVVAPKMWPSFRSRPARWVNQRLLVRALAGRLKALENPVVLTTLPLVADLVERLPPARWIYYCVDDFSVWPGYDGETMGRMEACLVPQMDACIAVSDTLARHLKQLGTEATLLTHGVDLAGWQSPPFHNTSLPAELAGVAGPILLFWGVIDRRLDMEIVRHLATHSGATVVLVGPREDPDPELDRLANVVLRPPVAFDRLPHLAQAADVLIMPYADAPVTRAMQPLKMKEYLATGRPAVVRQLPSTLPWADALDVAATPAEFLTHVLARLGEPLPMAQQKARLRLSTESWAAKADQLAAVLDEVATR